jgi:hypothetical protein
MTLILMMMVVLVAVAENVKMDINNPWIKLLLLKISPIQVSNRKSGTCIIM